MKQLLLFTLWISLIGCHSQKAIISSSFSDNQVIVSDDITHFLEAYDAIHGTEDTIKQMAFLQNLFLDKASLGQQNMIEARNYTAEEYLESITSFPLFWNSIRPNMENIEIANAAVRKGIDQLAAIYPSLRRSTIYYTVGNFRSPGTGYDSLVLLGAEFALGDLNVNSSELPKHIQNYYKINPIERLNFLAAHEYVHTQQKDMVHNILSLTLYEGIAEYMAIKATGQKSPWKAFTVGEKNGEKVKNKFIEDLFLPNRLFNWLWNSDDNIFGASEMSYYVGSKIASLHYDNADNKQAAINKLIELDYQDESEVEAIVDGTNYLGKTLEDLYTNTYEPLRPEVIKIEQFASGDTISAGPQLVTFHFSQAMDIERRGFDYGPLGEEAVLRVQKVIGFSEDAKALTIEVNLEKNNRYQCMLTTNFRSNKGYPIKPFLVDLWTK